MDRNDERPLLGNGYHLDLVNHFGLMALCREDGTKVAGFSVWDARSEAIERAARRDLRRFREG
jgi:hypothetical protein